MLTLLISLVEHLPGTSIERQGLEGGKEPYSIRLPELWTPHTALFRTLSILR
jgi:hypothetical protein